MSANNQNDINSIMREIILFNEANRQRKVGNVPLAKMPNSLVDSMLKYGMITVDQAKELNIYEDAAPKMQKVLILKKNNDCYPWGQWKEEEKEVPVDPEKKQEPKKNEHGQQGTKPNPQTGNGQKQQGSNNKPSNNSNDANNGPDGQPDKSGDQKGNQKKKDGNVGSSRPDDNSTQSGDEADDSGDNGQDGQEQGDGIDQTNNNGTASNGGGEYGGDHQANKGNGHGYYNSPCDDDRPIDADFINASYINVQVKEKGDHRLETYDSLEDYINAADDQDEPKSSWKERSSRDTGKEEWSGTKNFEEAIEIARSGWPEGVVKLEQIVDAYNKLSKWTVDKTRHLDVGGTYPNVPVYLGGDPACMFNDGDLNKGIKPVMHIVVNRGYSWLVPIQRVFNFGAAIMVCIDQIETIGTRVELDVATANIGDLFGPVTERPVWTTMTTVKKAQEYIEKNRMAYALAHPGYSRNLKYSILEQIDKYEEPFHWGYGKPITLPKDMVPFGATYVPQLEDLLPKQQQGIWDDIESSVKVMQRHLGIVTMSDGTIELSSQMQVEAA